MRDGQRISIAKYFWKTYNLKITDKRQPMLVVKQGGTEVLLPTELVCIDGVPGTIRQNGQQMRQLLQQVRQTPEQKCRSINEMINKLFKVSKWAEWDINVDRDPQEVKSRRLGAPELDIKDPRGKGKQVYASERILKSLPVYQCENITKIKLLVFCDKRS